MILSFITGTNLNCINAGLITFLGWEFLSMHLITMLWVTLWWTFRRAMHSCQGSIVWILLAYTIQRCQRLCDKIWQLSTYWKHFKSERDVAYFHRRVQAFWWWGVDFMGPFPPSCSHNYILVVVEYVSTLMEAISCAKNDVVTVSKFLQKNIFTRFNTLKALISDAGTHFLNHIISKLLIKYNVQQRMATAHHPQTNGQAKYLIKRSSLY